MPAKKIIEAVGSTCPVIGSSIATVTAGPRPGSTPMAVPSAQPASAHSRLTGVAAVANPPSNWLRMSIMSRPLQIHPVAVRPGRLTASTLVNSQ